MPDQHAKLSASSSHRWLACPMAPTMEADYPDEGSPYAAEGTKAHALAEKTLKRYLKNGKLSFTAKDKDNHDAEMIDYVTEYLEYCIEEINSAKANDPCALVLIEERLDFSKYVPDGFGTGDLVIIADDVLRIIDLKYGKGVSVSAESNSQLMLYGLGAVEKFSLYYDFSSVKMTIHQPRLHNITSYEMYVDDLVAWGTDIVVPKAEKAFNGEGQCVAGDHCKFCKARHECKANADKMLELFDEYGDEEPGLLSAEAIADILARADTITKWIKGLQEWALQEALGGKEWPGFKLVEGRSNRKIKDEDGAIEALRAAGIEDDIIFKPEQINTLTALTKALGAKQLETIIGEYIIKPPGAPTLVPNSDKREALSTNFDFDDDLI